MIKKIHIGSGAPSKEMLEALSKRCNQAMHRLRRDDSEVRVPLFLEFSGSPKSGKTTIIGIIGHFLRRMGFNVVQTPEGASLRTPEGLRDDLLDFNAWSGCYALQQILIDSSIEPAPEIVILDRGLFDVMGWMEYLCITDQRVTETEQQIITQFFSLDLWRRRIKAVFLFTADNSTSIERELHGKLTKVPGRVMDPSTLEGLRKAYQTVGDKAEWEGTKFYSFDTSNIGSEKVDFQQVAYQVVQEILTLIEDATSQSLLVTKKVGFQGFTKKQNIVEDTINLILNNGEPIFKERSAAEQDIDIQQIVPYAILENPEGKYFWTKRRPDVRRKELRNKITLLVGGHAEFRDWKSINPRSVFENCIRRELEEELIGIQIKEIWPIGFINDVRTKMGQQHLAFIHHVKIGGRTAVRRQAIDQEFGKTIHWRSADEIKNAIEDMDPWSQLVAHALFGAELPDNARQPVLFEDAD